MERPNYILDAQTKKGERVTSFALELKDALLDYQNWVDELRLTNKDLWYTDIFEFGTGKHIGVVHLSDKNLPMLSGAPSNSRIKPFKINRFIAKLKGELR